MADTSKDVFRDLIDDIQRFGGRWASYCSAIESAYAEAYESQKMLLSKTKASIEAQRKQEEADRIFALSLLTAGMGGILATHFTNRVKGVVIKNLADTVLAAEKDAIVNDVVARAVKAATMGKDTLKGASKEVQDWALKMIGVKNAEVSDEPFIPSGVSPAQYGADLRQGAQERLNVLNDIVFGWRETADEFPLPWAINVSSNFKQRTYFTKAPPSQIDPAVKSLLSLRAKLALWIAWGLRRDKKYWSIQSAMRFYGPRQSEVFQWEGLRKELVSIGVPQGVVSFREYYSPRQYTPGMMNMDEFLKWVASSNAITLLFQGVPHDDEGIKWAIDRWNHKLSVQ